MLSLSLSRFHSLSLAPSPPLSHSRALSPISLSRALFLPRSACISVCLYVCLFVSVYLSVYIGLSLYVCLSVYLSVCLFLYICLSVTA